MDGFTVTELITRAVKYFLEGLAVALAVFIIPQKKLNVEEILAIAIVAAVVFALLDLLAPSIGLTARQGAGFGLGANLLKSKDVWLRFAQPRRHAIAKGSANAVDVYRNYF